MTNSSQMNALKIKICGMTRPADVLAAVELKVDAIGMILKGNSPRLLTTQQAKTIREFVPSTIKLVGVFVNPGLDEIEVARNEVGIDLVQLHGEEIPEFATSLKLPYVKAIRARSLSYIESEVDRFESACAYLIDPYVKGQHGGTGKRLDPSLWPSNANGNKLVLAGGLSVDNVVEAARQCAPYGVDLNSGLESAPGIKDPELMSLAVKRIRDRV